MPVRDEEQAVGESVGSMLAQNYPGDLEIIALDDRFTDRTGEILDRHDAGHPVLRAAHVKDLPEVWLGKNHALYLGAMKARGDWLLFTDADVRVSPRCFREAVGYAALNRLDHLTLPPEMVSRGVLLEGFVAAFELIFSLSQRPWRARDPRAKNTLYRGLQPHPARALSGDRGPPGHSGTPRRRYEARQAGREARF